MSEKPTVHNYGGVGPLWAMLLLGFGPLNWTFPHWVWALALAAPIIALVIVGLFGLVAVALQLK